jgi:hypothetical protein
MFSGSAGTADSRVSQLDDLQQQIDSFLVRPAASAKLSPRGAAVEQLTALLCTAAAEGPTGQLQPVDTALSDSLGAWMRALASMKTVAASHAPPRELIWLPAAVAQWRIMQQASDSSVERLLIGEGAVPKQYLE